MTKWERPRRAWDCVGERLWIDGHTSASGLFAHGWEYVTVMEADTGDCYRCHVSRLWIERGKS